MQPFLYISVKATFSLLILNHAVAALTLNSTACMQVQDGNGTLLWSPKKRFSLKFFTQNRYRYLVIAYVEQSQETLVWAANRNKPILVIAGEWPCLRLAEAGVDLVLEDTRAQSTRIWSAGVRNVTSLELHDSGNLEILDGQNSTLWTSFQHPTDTILQGGTLDPGKSLASNVARGNLSEGPFSIEMEPGGVILYYRRSPGARRLPYAAWTYNPLGVGTGTSALQYALYSACNRTYLYYGSRGESINLNQVGNVVTAECLRESNSQRPRQIMSGAQLGNSTSLRFLRLDMDGNVRTYMQSSNELIADADIFSVFFRDVCRLPTICGTLGLCRSGGNCSCYDDKVFRSYESGVGCMPLKPPVCGAENQMLDLDGIDYFANSYISPTFRPSTLHDCRAACLLNCSCSAAFFWNNTQSCYHYSQIDSLIQVSDDTIKAFIKVGPGSIHQVPSPANSPNIALLVGIPLAVSAISLIAVFGAIVCWWKCRNRNKKTDEDTFLENLPGLPPRFSYRELDTATSGFSTELGAGGFGTVFEGNLPDGTRVAVKKLSDADHEHQQFRAEVAALGSVNHMNLVRLRGFCSDGPRRLLVYEYMSNGSLDHWLFNKKKPFLDWQKRFSIAVDTARGLSFLHDMSRDRILHLDVKPQNILLDANFSAKLSDFGLAKLLDRTQSRAFTRIRGTPGYLAPEWLFYASATDKSDVYSFGMVLLELISGRKILDRSLPEEMEYFPCLAVQMMEQGQMRMMVDPRLGEFEEREWEKAERVIKVAMWCIQQKVSLRPSMSEVLLMLEDHLPVSDPPLSLDFLMRTKEHISVVTSQSSSSAGTVGASVATLSVSLCPR